MLIFYLTYFNPLDIHKMADISGLMPSQNLPHLWESKALWNTFWKLALVVVAGRKDHLPHQLVTVSVETKAKALYSLVSL